MNKILSLDGIHFSYGEEDPVVLADLSLDIPTGKVTAILGPNGTGKTTLLNIIAGLEKINSGKIEVGETVVFGYYKQEGIKFKDDKKVIEVIQDIAEEISVGDGKKLSAIQFYFQKIGR